MEKIIEKGKVAVAYSPGFGAGWSTWESVSPFEPKVIEMIRAGKQNQITGEWCEKELGLKNIYCGGAEGLEIAWLPQGTKFYIHEYDGSESIKTGEDLILEA